MTQLGQVKDRILYLQRNFSECQAQGTFNQNDVLGRFDWTTLANQYLDMYKSISNI
jgi:hypothetical protein